MGGAGGSFNDGKSAARIDVRVGFLPDGLRLTDDRGQDLALWPYEDIEPLDEAFGENTLRLKLKGEDGPRLTLSDTELCAELMLRAPHLVPAKRGWLAHSIMWLGLTVLSIPVLVWVVWAAVPGLARAASHLVPVSWEVALGEQVLGQAVKIFAELEGKEEVAFCRAEAGRRALDGLTTRLSEVAASPYELRVSVINLDTPNAFALPGGRIVIFRGLIDFAKSPDEVSGVLAHEFGHVVHRHGTKGILESLGLAFFFGVLLGDVGSGTVGLAGETLVSMSHSRDAEAEADRTAVALLSQIGVSSRGLSDFFARLGEEHGDLPPALQLLSTHPSNESREQLFAEASQAGAESLTPAEWRSLREICSVTADVP